MEEDAEAGGGVRFHTDPIKPFYNSFNEFVRGKIPMIKHLSKGRLYLPTLFHRGLSFQYMNFEEHIRPREEGT
jgi:hypothetical protein